MVRIVRGRSARRRHGDAGSATIWVLATGMALVLVAVAVAMAGAASVARHRAQSAADLAALAAALRAWEGETAACERAAEISARNGARLVECRLEDLDAEVAVEVAPALLAGVGVARAAARAGLVEASAHPGESAQQPLRQLSWVWRRGRHCRTVASFARAPVAPGGPAVARCPRGLRRRSVLTVRGRSQKGALMELSLATRSVSDHMVLEIGGEIDVYTAPKLRERLIEMVNSGEKRVVVDLGRVEFLDSTGLGVLVGAHRRLRARDGSLNLVCPHERLLKVFRITGLDNVFDIHRSVEEATTGGSAHAARAGA